MFEPGPQNNCCIYECLLACLLKSSLCLLLTLCLTTGRFSNSALEFMTQHINTTKTTLRMTPLLLKADWYFKGRQIANQRSTAKHITKATDTLPSVNRK